MYKRHVLRLALALAIINAFSLPVFAQGSQNQNYNPQDPLNLFDSGNPGSKQPNAPPSEPDHNNKYQIYKEPNSKPPGNPDASGN